MDKLRKMQGKAYEGVRSKVGRNLKVVERVNRAKATRGETTPERTNVKYPRGFAPIMTKRPVSSSVTTTATPAKASKSKKSKKTKKSTLEDLKKRANSSTMRNSQSTDQIRVSRAHARSEDIDEDDHTSDVLSQFRERARAKITSTANSQSVAQLNIDAISPESINLPRQTNFKAAGVKQSQVTPVKSAA